MLTEEGIATRLFNLSAVPISKKLYDQIDEAESKHMR